MHYWLHLSDGRRTCSRLVQTFFQALAMLWGVRSYAGAHDQGAILLNPDCGLYDQCIGTYPMYKAQERASFLDYVFPVRGGFQSEFPMQCFSSVYHVGCLLSTLELKGRVARCH